MSIRIQGLFKKFGDVNAVNGVSLDVQQGHMLVLLGPSGCGKTTVMRCIVGLEQPTAGRIEIAGKPVFDSERRVNTPVNERNVGMVFQSYAIWPHMTVFENVAFPLEMKGLPAAEVRDQVEDMLAVVGLSAMMTRGASALSGGQMQRVALARSMVMRPSVLLFDEPLSNLDARLRDHLRVELRELQTRFSITSVFVTHDQQEALALADEVAVMQAGNLLQRNDPISIYRRPSSSTVAEFIGYQNVFPVEVQGERDGGTGFRIEGIDRAFVAATPPGSGSGGTFACIRPGDIVAELAGDASTALASNQVRGEVTLASFMGSHVHLRVRLDEDDKVFEVFDKSVDPAMRVGARVSLTIAAGAILLLPRSAA
ncbi:MULTISPECIES: ABC transporter ATP-binding protein [unclassified Chelatococcus]|uniref:ABC transporter ATP-binding protein n=1 Tax=unclassified Chelatococcus TaxID=2638111 RepID=UPI001BD1665C|nr:ABC transporter ATP-binding protein [Chelatococcus sp.]MBS7742823.1 ABC transporter ATP-binding protein [Chelatococcus sp. HY11]CAH1654127.1 Fe(3+) ions import ATP-binding protein FbpC [Hyphomicrobiales bacterium]MBX3542059.1 ABC transporter ATP-binding protein [Chelatococcus sp.]MCO5074049.1 ABC transporter ATP-binding protein [Chelatococcus sp.]CAH1694778.1 Fe(3+) ions import ATP-binding protein FbpC [Hyphomicrobiales bacterium]